MSRRYGVPYMGSKNSIAEWIIEQMPPADVFIDMFAGGCAVTHAALLSGKYKSVIANDINPLPVKLFTDAVNGVYAHETRWISREEFERLKDTDGYIKYCWSFGNNGRDYLYGKDIEPYKKAMHYAIVHGDSTLIKKCFPDADFTALDSAPNVNARAAAWARINRDMWRTFEVGSVRTLEGLQRLQRLQRLQSLQSLQRLQSLQSLQSSYEKVNIPERAVVYCDIPYKGTSGYDVEFDHDRFYKWAKAHPCYISEYDMPEGFKCVASIEKRMTMMANGNNLAIEKLYYSGENPYQPPKQLSMWDDCGL